LLERQALLQNGPDAGPCWYPALDGFPVPEEAIRVVPLGREDREVVLASDGYPVLHPTLEESEAALHFLLESDPMLFRVHRSTKGRALDADSFDDRAYLRLSLLPDE